MAPFLRQTRRFPLPPKPPFINLLRKFTLLNYTVSTFSSDPPPNFRKTFSHILQDCTCQRALDPGKQAHARMIITGFQPTIFVFNCLLQMYIKCSCLDYAIKVFDNISERDTVTWNAMISAHSSRRNMGMAQSFFDLMPNRDVISWNSLISGYVQNGYYRRSLDVFARMGKEGVNFDWTSFAVVLKACSCLDDYCFGVQVHAVVIKVGLDSSVMTGSALVDMYAKCKKLCECLDLFDELPEKNCVSWSAVIAGCVQNNEFFVGLDFFKEMQREGVGVNQSTYASVFRSCAGLCDLRLGSQLHGHALKNDCGKDTIVGTAILDMYAKCGNISYARQIFDLLPNRSLQSHNALIVGYARCDHGFEALEIFRQNLLKSDLGFDEISLSGAFSACAVIKGCLEGVQLHGLAYKTPFMSSVCVANAILDMYGKAGALVEARYVFDHMGTRDSVSWNSIIAAYEQNSNDKETALLFVSMLQSGMEPDEFTYGSLLKACAGQQALSHGTEIHGQIIKSGMGLESFVGSALVDMYCKCGKNEEAEKLHYRMDEQTIVSWNAIISGLSLHEQSEEAKKFFCKMMEMGVKPDNFTYATVLDICANLATIALGKQIHAQIIKQALQGDVYVTSTLVDMYSKCGELQDCRLVFEKASNRDFVTWNAMLCSYSQHGLGKDALSIFQRMQVEGVKPNHATFVAVLRACGHMGLVEKGLHYFNSMQVDYGLDPEMDHYSCMVDILGRSGRVIEALKLIQEMPFEPDDVVWRTLLSICKMHGNVEVAEKAAHSLMQMDPQDSGTCVLLSNIYADAGMWEEVSKLRQIMRHGRLRKEPGCSWVEIKSEVHMFLVGDKAHPRCEEIYENLHILIDEMKWAGYVRRTGEPEDEYLEFSPA